MKYCILNFILFITLSFCFAQSTPNKLKLISKVSVPEILPLDELPNYFIQNRLEESNPEFDGIVLVSRNDLSVSFALIDNSKKIVWQKPVESAAVSMSSGQPGIVVAGKKQNKGYFETDVPFDNFGFTLYNSTGEKIITELSEHRIYQMEFTRSNLLIVLSSAGVLCYDLNGKSLWTVKEVFQEIRFTDGDEFIIADRYLVSQGLVQKSLIDPETGNILKRWQYPPDENINIAFINKKSNQIVISEFNSKERTASWNLSVCSIETFKPLFLIKKTKADPFLAAFNPKNNSYVFVMARARTAETKNAGEIIFTQWSMTDNKLTEVSLGFPDIIFSIDKTEITNLENGYEITIGKVKYILRD